MLPVMSDVARPDESDPDWIRRGSWDLTWGGRIIDNVEDLREWLYVRQLDPEEFKRWDVYVGNVDRPGMGWLRNL
jgi:hypothetical protein